MLGMLKKKTIGHMAITLNAKLQPMHRAELVDSFDAASKKSRLEGRESVAFGRHQGLRLYLNGTDLPDQVHAHCDSSHVYSECDRLLEGVGQVNSCWQGPAETAFHMYGEDFEVMRTRIQPLVDTYPLCQKARIVRIA